MIDARIEQLLQNLKIKHRIVEHQAVFTVAEANKIIGDRVPVKNLLLVNKINKVYLVIVRGDKRLNLKQLAETIDSNRLSFASQELLMELFGVEPGAVSIFGLVHEKAKSVEVIVDKTVVDSGEEIGFHPNDNTRSIFLTADNITKILESLDNRYRLIDLL
jgi:Ala-tRNA(Pro) deacylase